MPKIDPSKMISMSYCKKAFQNNYYLQNSHFLPALIKKIFIASKKKKNKIVKLWGTGKPLREILYVDEAAKACEFFLKKKQNPV